MTALAAADQQEAACSEATGIVAELVEFGATPTDCDCLVLEAADAIASGFRAPCDHLRHGGVQVAFAWHSAGAELLCRACAAEHWSTGSVWVCRRCTAVTSWPFDLVVACCGALLASDLVCTRCRAEMSQVAV